MSTSTPETADNYAYPQERYAGLIRNVGFSVFNNFSVKNPTTRRLSECFKNFLITPLPHSQETRKPPSSVLAGGFRMSFSLSFRAESRDGYKSIKIKRETMPEISHKGLFALKKQNRFSL